MSKRPTATILKLIRGDQHTARLKDDKPKIDELPRLPPGLVLSAAEQSMWSWLVENVYVKGVHGTADGPAFAKIARLWVRVNDADSKVERFGMVMKSPRTGKPELQPYARLSRDLWQQLGIALAEIGATPAGRVKLAGPRGSALPGEPTSWDDIEMRNQAMARKLVRKQCFDVSKCPRTMGGDYVMFHAIDLSQDFCDATTEEWIWTIGRLRRQRAVLLRPNSQSVVLNAGTLLASTTDVFYRLKSDEADFECVWLR